LLRIAGRPYRPSFGSPLLTHREELFDLGLDYRGLSVLDAGCNLGIIGYEIAKRRPASYHGIDGYVKAVETARAIFSMVDVPSRIDRVNLSDHGSLTRILRPAYDAVLLIHVLSYVIRQYGESTAEQTLSILADRSRQWFVLGTSPRHRDWLFDRIAAAGFALHKSILSSSEQYPATYALFQRREADAL
jgi:hypothetical protein